MSEVDLKIINEIYTILEKLNANNELLSIIGSWKDTLEDEQILNELVKINNSIEVKITKHEDLFESVMILYNDCIRMRGNAITQKEANILIENKYDAGFFAGVEKTYQNTERLLQEIINDYNMRLSIKKI
tara:strand:- start:881 stop:1270 length:390 start_codon:yes stop_codon:yes gene_type:complete